MPFLSNLNKHIRFVERHLSLLPASRESLDVNRMAIIFYAIISLSSLNQNVKVIYKGNIEWIRKNYITRTTEKGNFSGFVGSLNLDIPDTMTLSLPNTLFGLLTLLTMEDTDFFDKIVDRESLARFVSSCQLPKNGSFVSVLDYKTNEPSPVDAHDLRFCYIAVAILYVLGCRTDEQFKKYIDVQKLTKFILDQYCTSGGFGAYGEAHGGYTSCALAALSLLNKLDMISIENKEKTIQWLLERQVSNLGSMRFQDVSNKSYDEADHGGFQGRENKYADTCYAFWCLNSLSILTPDYNKLCDTSLVKEFLLTKTQNLLTGGFMKNEDDDADLYHTCLSIAALKLIDNDFNGVLCIPKNISEKFSL